MSIFYHKGPADMNGNDSIRPRLFLFMNNNRDIRTFDTVAEIEQIKKII